MNRAVPLSLIALALALGGCGARRDLTPPDNQSLPPAPYGATQVPKSGDLLATESQDQPDRSDEVLKESKDRPADPFDLPPTR